ncbi:MAG: hypothetical protein M3R29_06620 [Verrucomicrobiota bacterium]|nr:hypothetical protein [Verrucomicrobiota bacterium]
MIKKVNAALLVALASLCVLSAQESPTPGASPIPSATPTPSPTPPPAPARSVRISFLPPPLEGTISLGVYDSSRKIVRVLVQEGDVDEFEVGADALIVKWDGKNDREEDLPAGKYQARGYLVGQFKVEDLGKAETPPPDSTAMDHVQVKLVANPLSKNARLIVDLAVGFDEESIFLKTTDGLPLFTVIQTPQLVRASITKNGEKAVDIWADGGAAVEQIRVSNVDKMMAFDCGEFELK